MADSRYEPIVEAAVKLFDGQRGSALAWINEPALGLGWITPKAAVDAGKMQEVLDLIYRLEHGVVV